MIESIEKAFQYIKELKEYDNSERKRIVKAELKSFFASYAADISGDAIFDDIPCFPHKLFGIFISRGAIIGKNCVIFQQVTIGSNLLIDSKTIGFPKIGNNVYIGAGAKVIGNITIGNNVRIGANCVVTESVPSNSVVVLPKPRVIQRENLDNRYFSFHETNGWAYYQDGDWLRDIDEYSLNVLENL